MSDLNERLKLPWPPGENVGEATIQAWVIDLCAEAADALSEAADAWEAFKAANTTDAHFAAVARLDAALSSPHATKGDEG